MSPKLRALQAQKAETVAAMRALHDKAATENRDFTADEQAEFDALEAKSAALTASINREQSLSLAEAGLGDPGASNAAPRAPPSAVTIPAAAVITVAENADSDPNRGFRSLGEYAMAVRGAVFSARGGGSLDQRLMALGGWQAAAPSTVGTTGAGSDGGFLIPPGFSTNIWAHSLEEQALLPMTDRLPVSGNGMSLPKDETTPWGSNGVRAYWQSEATAGTLTKPVFGRTDLKLKKLMALVPMSDELMSDTVALGAYLEPNMARSIRWKTDEAILFGTGAGTPQGALTSGAVVTQTKESGQAAATFNVTNAGKLISRLLPGCYGRAVWLVNNDVLPQLFGFVVGNTAVYLPDAKVSPYGTLLGRPVIVTQHAKSLGTQGDVSLVDLTAYQSIENVGGIQTATSMHLYFDADSVAFRATFRVDGQPKFSAPVSPANGSATLSAFVQLETRS